MTRAACLGHGNVSVNAVIDVSAVEQGFLSPNTLRHAIEVSAGIDRWRRALGAGSTELSAAGRIPIRARVAHQRVLDEFAVIAKKCRKRRRLSIEAVAQHSGIPAKRIQQFERGAVPASESEILRLSAVYGVGASEITRRLERVFYQFAGNHVCTLENILRLKWSQARYGPACASSPQNARVASKCRRSRDRTDHEFTIADRSAFRLPTLAESILAECIQLLTTTICIQAFVATVDASASIQREGNCPQPAGAGADMKAMSMMRGDELLVLAHANLRNMVDRLDMLTLRHPFPSSAPTESTDPQGIGDVVPFPDQEIRTERARMADAMKLIVLFKTHSALPTHEAHRGTQLPIDRAGSLCARTVSHAQQDVSTLNCAIELLTEAEYNLFELSGRCT